MRITSVEKQKRPSSHYMIHLDNGTSFMVHEDTLVKHRLLKDAQLTPLEVEHIVLEDQGQRAYRDALLHIGRRPRSQWEVREKLLQLGYDSNLVQSVVEKLVDQRYVDDQQFARMWVEERIVRQKKGRNVIMHELRQKGVAKEWIVAALEHVEDGAEMESAYNLLCKRWPHMRGTDQEKKRKLGQYLLRRGFTSSVIRESFRRWNKESHEALHEERPDT